MPKPSPSTLRPVEPQTQSVPPWECVGCGGPAHPGPGWQCPICRFSAVRTARGATWEVR